MIGELFVSSVLVHLSVVPYQAVCQGISGGVHKTQVYVGGIFTYSLWSVYSNAHVRNASALSASGSFLVYM